MAISIQQAKLTGFAAYLPSVAEAKVEALKQVYEENRYRVYALAFWMTDNEIAAEDLMSNTFIRVFACGAECAQEEDVDRALITELRELMPLGVLTLDCSPAADVKNIRGNTKRVHLERAVVQVPATERMIFLMHDVEGYEHARIARMLGITDQESRQGLHHARLRIREILATTRD